MPFAAIDIGIMQAPLFRVVPSRGAKAGRKSWGRAKVVGGEKRERANVQLFNAGSTGGGQPSNLGQRKKTSSLVFSPEQTNDSGGAAPQTYYVLVNHDPLHS